MREVNLKEILGNQLNTERITPIQWSGILRAMKEACDQTVDLCVEHAETIYGEECILKCKDQIK